MRLANVKLPEALLGEMKDASARLGVSQSVLHRAALRSLLSRDPSRDEVLHLETAEVADLRTGATGERARSLLEDL